VTAARLRRTLYGEEHEAFRAVVALNLTGTLLPIQAFGEAMAREKRGSIVNISSVLGIITAGLPQAAYSASKAGLMGLTRDLAQQWTSRKGIRVNALAPGFFASEMTAEYPEEYVKATAERVLAGRYGDPQELAAAMLLLASPAGGYMTGQTIVVDGGVAIT
jgi:NAD(P)-dependent dehydrogenase (short-subunit alcohol dehydrogenase family)